MLAAGGLQVMNVESVADAYAIAANYMHRAGALAEKDVLDERLLSIIVGMFEHGEFNTLRLANKAISRFEACLGA